MKIIGNLRWDLGVGIFAMMGTFFSSVANNLWTTTIIRALIALVLFALLNYFLRLFLSYLLLQGTKKLDDHDLRGASIDLVTPEETPSILFNEPEFKETNPAQMANAIRKITD